MTHSSKLNNFLQKLANNPESVAFSDTMGIVDDLYKFTPVRFENGGLVNEAGQNSGSCKLFAFAKMHDLSKDETLHCFGTYYTNDVLQNSNGDDHQNIRNFMKSGWEGVSFDGAPLEFK